MIEVELYFDFISPYSHLAQEALAKIVREHPIRLVVRPVVFAKLLEATGLVGPVEVEAKRRYSFADVVRAADDMGVPLEGPPEHPFRSLEALRVATLFADDERALALVRSLFRAIWGEGRDPRDWGVLTEATAAVGLDADDLEARAGAPENKDRLRRSTEEALERGVFGVPTFSVGDELFWGHDRIRHLVGRITGHLAPLDEARVERMLARPYGVERRKP